MTAIALVFLALVALCSAASVETQLSPRINDVRRVNPGELPYMVSLQYTILNVRFCNGILLNKDYVLTTADCLSNKAAIDIEVAIGSTDLHNPYIFGRGSKVIRHKKYNPSASFLNNIGLLKLRTPILESHLISYAKLPYPHEFITPDEGLQIAGWGLVEDGSRDADNYLQLVNVGIIQHDTCSYIYQSLRHIIYGSQVCGYKPSGEKYSCQKQGGAALISRGKVFGILSYQQDCGRDSYPAVYELVASHLDWIRSKSSSTRHVPALWSSYGAMLFLSLSSVLLLPNSIFK